jgi:hypothetical protein
MPYRNGNIVWNATTWTPGMIRFVKRNWRKKTNKELATHLGLRLTVTRNKLRELGLKRMELEYWNSSMIVFLKASYQTLGDVEIMNFFKRNYPKQKGWKRNAISKKRKQIGLMRTIAQVKEIAKRNSRKGGPCYTIEKNSASRNMHPVWIAQRIAWRNSELQQELLKYPEIIEAGKQLILLKRNIRDHEKQINRPERSSICAARKTW